MEDFYLHTFTHLGIVVVFTFKIGVVFVFMFAFKIGVIFVAYLNFNGD